MNKYNYFDKNYIKKEFENASKNQNIEYLGELISHIEIKDDDEYQVEIYLTCCDIGAFKSLMFFLNYLDSINYRDIALLENEALISAFNFHEDNIIEELIINRNIILDEMSKAHIFSKDNEDYEMSLKVNSLLEKRVLKQKLDNKLDMKSSILSVKL